MQYIYDPRRHTPISARERLREWVKKRNFDADWDRLDHLPTHYGHWIIRVYRREKND